MRNTPTYLLCHGFGFTNEYWNSFVPLLDGNVEFFDKNLRPTSGKNYIGVGHSLGFLKLNNSGIKFRALIGLQGFLNFCGNNPIKKKVLQKNLDRMISAFEKNPKQALAFFYKLCGYDGKIPSDISREELICDLKIMKSSFDHCKVPTLIIGSEDDQVVAKNILLDNFQNNDLVSLKFLDGVNHTLGHTKAEKVFVLVQDFLRG